MDKETFEKQIRKKIIAVHADISLSPIEKQKKVLELMKQLHTDITKNEIGENNISTNNTTTKPIDESEVIDSECVHYQRLCLVECPFLTCKKFTKCRICHDSMVTDHQFDRFSVRNVMCINCREIQDVGYECKKCNTVFAKYYCDVCHLFENSTEKEIFHCKDCGICRVGKVDAYLHCVNCNLCINKELYNNHKCFANTWNDCPVCMEELKKSIKQLFLLPCGHGMHVECLKTLLSNDYRCPLCKKSIGDMSTAWDKMTNDLNQMRGNIQIDLITSAGEPIKKTCMCNDCGKMFEVNRNVFNMYSCPDCKSFNSS